MDIPSNPETLIATCAPWSRLDRKAQIIQRPQSYLVIPYQPKAYLVLFTPESNTLRSPRWSFETLLMQTRSISEIQAHCKLIGRLTCFYFSVSPLPPIGTKILDMLKSKD